LRSFENVAAYCIILFQVLTCKALASETWIQ
jgi:hypothetical protein